MTIKIRYSYVLLASAVLTLVFLCFYSEKNWQNTPARPQDSICLPVLLYRNISTESTGKSENTITPQELENDLQYLKKQGYTAISAKELTAYTEHQSKLPEKPILLTFDNGFQSFHQYAYPLLKKYNCKAVLSVIGVYAEISSQIPIKSTTNAHLSWKEINELSQTGLIEIGNQSYDMHEATAFRKGCQIKEGESREEYQAAVQDDIGRLQDKLNSLTGQKPLVFSYPLGLACPELQPLLKPMGIKITLSDTPGLNFISDSESLFCLKRYTRSSGISSEPFFKKILS